VSQAGNSLTGTILHRQYGTAQQVAAKAPCKTRPDPRRRGLLLLLSLLIGAVTPLSSQQREADEAWAAGRYPAARAGYQQVLATNPRSARANLRLGILLSWEGKLDSALVHLARARVVEPADVDTRLIQARVMAWNNQYSEALLRYDSLLAERPGLREARLDRARTLAWAGRLDEARAGYQSLIAKDPTDRDALLGSAQVRGWKGDLAGAEQQYRAILTRNSRDVDARVGLGYVYLWQGREAAAGRQAKYALAMDSTHKDARALRRAVGASRRASLETSANWSNDSDDNTSYWQTLTASAPLGDGVSTFGSVNALENSDPVRQATRVGAEAGLSFALGRFRLSGAGGARRLTPEVAASRTSATYRGRVGYRPVPSVGLNLGYARAPFDETAVLIEQELDLESLEGGIDIKPFPTLTIYGGGGALWLSDGNHRTNGSAGLTQQIHRRFFLGVFGRTMSYERRGIGYFSPDRFWVLEGNAGYNFEGRVWAGGLSGGLGAQQVGSGGVAQNQWHLEGRIGPRWGIGNRIELYGLITNSAVSSTSGAFRYRSAGLTVRLGL
jgi:tetratricopeptide (TPR) repeat protein